MGGGVIFLMVDKDDYFFVAYCYRINRMDFHLLAFRQLFKQSNPSFQNLDVFKNYFKSIIFHYGQEKL